MSVFYKLLLRCPKNPHQVSDEWTNAVAELAFLPSSVLTQLNADIVQHGYITFTLASRITEILDSADMDAHSFPQNTLSEAPPLSDGAAKLLLRGGLKEVLRNFGPHDAIKKGGDK